MASALGLELKAFVSDSGDADGRYGTPHCPSGGLQRSRCTATGASKQSSDAGKMQLNDVLQVYLATDERSHIDHVVQWKQRIHEFETTSRETCQTSSQHPSSLRDHQKTLVSNAQTSTEYVTVCAALEVFLAVKRKCGQCQRGPEPIDIDAMKRKGKRWQEQRQGQAWQGEDKGKTRARTPRKRKACDSKVTEDTVFNGGIG